MPLTRNDVFSTRTLAMWKELLGAICIVRNEPVKRRPKLSDHGICPDVLPESEPGVESHYHETECVVEAWIVKICWRKWLSTQKIVPAP